MNTENNTTGRALWRTGLRVLGLAFGALGWVLSTLDNEEKREEEELPWVDPGRGTTDYPRYSDDGFRQY